MDRNSQANKSTCSVTSTQSSSLKRKKMDDSSEEPEVQPKKRPTISRRRKTNELPQPVRRINPYRPAKFFGRYRVMRALKSGNFTTIFSGIRNIDRKEVAFKFIYKHGKPRLLGLPGKTRRVPVEIVLLECLSKPPCCPYVIEMLEWYETPTAFIMVLECLTPCVNLLKLQNHQTNPLSEDTIKRIMYQLVQAAMHCRDRGVVHRDIEEANILLELSTFDVKLIDFTFGILHRDTPNTVNEGVDDTLFAVPRMGYQAEPVTVLSLGELFNRLLKNFTTHHSEATDHLIHWCLNPNPQKRPSFEQILAHQCFKKP